MRLSRRNLLLGAAAGGAASFVGFERRPASGLLTPISARNVAPSSIDAHAILREAIRTRTRITWGGSPALAAPAQDISVITIKVMNHILPALIFRLGQIQGVTDNTVGPLSFSSSASGQQSSGQVRLAGAKDFLLAQGLEQIAPESLAAGRYRKLAFNKWFANILHTGRIEGATVGTSVLPAPMLKQTAPSGDGMRLLASSEMWKERSPPFFGSCEPVMQQLLKAWLLVGTDW